jgi:hypothetical protein
MNADGVCAASGEASVNYEARAIAVAREAVAASGGTRGLSNLLADILYKQCRKKCEESYLDQDSRLA